MVGAIGSDHSWFFRWQCFLIRGASISGDQCYRASNCLWGPVGMAVRKGHLMVSDKKECDYVGKESVGEG